MKSIARRIDEALNESNVDYAVIASKGNIEYVTEYDFNGCGMGSWGLIASPYQISTNLINSTND